jgi:iron complex outermembrane receptor protein
MLKLAHNRIHARSLCCGAAVAALSVGAVQAQTSPTGPSGASSPSTVTEVVVTGTLLRGVAPAGAEPLGINVQEIQATGALTTNALLSSVPQVANQFNKLPLVGTTTASQVQINRPNLRDLPGASTQTGNSTLVLVDGHRIASGGVNQFAPDPDSVPPSILQRVEIVPDGGSSIYGTDAVGGVINFITKRRVDGVHLDVRGGLADHYHSVNTDILAGKSWDDSSVWIAYDFQHNTPLLSRHRDYVQQIDWSTGIPTGRQCTPPNIAIAGVNYAYPGLVPGSINACDTQRTGTLYPRQTRNSVYTGVSKDFGDKVKFDARAFYTERDTWASGGALRASANLPATNPFYVTVPGHAGQPENVSFDFGPVYGDSGRETSKLKEWGVTPSVTAELGHGWEVRGLLNFGGSHSNFTTAGVNNALLTQYASGATAATALNPFNLGATNPQLLANLTNFALAGESIVNMQNVRAVADGPLFSVPAGQVHLAVGAEYLRNHLSTRNAGAGLTPEAFQAQPYNEYTQLVKSVFGELQVPVVGPDNGVRGVHAFNVSASARYDSYSDFGSTTNPKVGVTWEPVDWISVRGSWGKSFNAPTPVDQLGSLNNTLLVLPFTINAPGVPPQPGSWLIAQLGSAPDLKPQTATEYSVGTDISWRMVPGLRTSVSYYKIDYQGLLAKAPVFDPTIFFASFPGFYILNPTTAQIAAAAAPIKGGAAQVQQFLQPGGPPVYEILDFRTNNLGSAAVRGIDFSAQYARATDFGGFDLSISGNYELENQTINGPGLPASDNLIAAGNPRFRFAATVGADVHQLRAELTLNHTGSQRVIYSPSQPQDSIPAFNVVNLYFKYALQGEDWRKNMFFTANIDNIFDAEPPVSKLLGGNGYINGSTLGRYFQIGAHKDF